jgi:hypothetical protein
MLLLFLLSMTRWRRKFNCFDTYVARLLLTYTILAYELRLHFLRAICSGSWVRAIPTSHGSCTVLHVNMPDALDMLHDKGHRCDFITWATVLYLIHGMPFSYCTYFSLSWVFKFHLKVVVFIGMESLLTHLHQYCRRGLKSILFMEKGVGMWTYPFLLSEYPNAIPLAQSFRPWGCIAINT